MTQQANEEIYEIGDVVRLTASSTKMTVDHHNDDGDIVCLWFNDADELLEAAFNPRQLILVKKRKDV